MSGNGLRCLVTPPSTPGAQRAGPGHSLGVLTPAGPAPGAASGRFEDGWMWASTEMGTPNVCRAPASAAMSGTASSVDVGNPHLVVLGPGPRDGRRGRARAGLSQEVGAGTGGTNVEFVALGPGRDELTMRVWERGVGETLACGTGSVAAAAALHHWGRVWDR